MRIILLGSTGLIGSYFSRYFQSMEQPPCVITLTRDHYNASSPEAEKHFMNIVRSGDVIINCVGAIKPTIDRITTYETVMLNTWFPIMLSDVCTIRNARLIHLCSDCVYTGNAGKYTESAQPDAKDIYAQTKSSHPQNATIIRTSFVGRKLAGGNDSLLNWIIGNKNKKITGYTNCIWNGVTCLELCKIVCSMLFNDKLWTGTRHVFSPDEISKYDLCKLVSDIYDLSITVTPVEATSISGSTVNGTLDRTLSTDFNDHTDILPVKTIRDQLLEQREFDNV